MDKIKFGEISLTDLSKQHLLECMDSRQVTMGPKTALLEQKFANLFRYKNAIAVSSGTSACMAANMSLYDFGAQPGDEVIVPALSFIATANAVRAAGFVPVFVDVKNDLLINEQRIEEAITPKTRAIMAVSLMGKPPKMDVIRQIADKHKLKFILDNCEGHGCQYKNKFMGEWADMAVYSCYAAHILFSVEMGFVCSNDDSIIASAESIRSHGRKPKSLYFDHIRYGLNLKPTDLHASIGLGTVDDFWDIFIKRKYNWSFLRNSLAQYQDLLWMSDEENDSVTSPHGFSLTVKPGTKINIEGLSKALDDANIEWKRNFGSMPTQHKCFEYLGHKFGNFPVAEYIGSNGIHIGVHYALSIDDLNRIVSTIKRYIDNV